MTKFLIIDGNSIGMRAALSMPKDSKDLMTSEGIQTGTIVRSFNMLNKIMLLLQPTHICCCWDTDGNTFRKQLYHEYKANRVKKPLPDGIDMHIIHKQFKFIRQLLEKLGIKNINMQGYEGDDLLGSISRISKADETYLVTGDRDAFQLITDDIYVVYPKSGFTDFDIVTKQYVEDKFDIDFDNYIGMKAIQGDNSDNIIGFKGCGPKTTAKLLKEFGSSDKVASLKKEALTHYSKTIRANLEDWQQRYSLIKTLVTIKTDLEIPYTFDDFEIELLKWEENIQTFEELEMYQLINRIKCGAVYRLKY